MGNDILKVKVHDGLQNH